MNAIQERLNKVLFEEDGKKKVLNRKLVKTVTLIFGTIGLLAICLGEPDRPQRKKTSLWKSGSTSQSNQIAIPEYKAVAVRVEKRRTTSGHTVYPGPSLISRPGGNKVLPGTTVRAVLVTAATDGPVKAKLIEDVLVDGDVRIPAGSVLVGVGTSLESRVSIQFFKGVVNEREVFETSAVAIDSVDELVGLQASKLNSDSIKLGASIGLNFVGGVAEGLKERTGQNGASVENNSLSNALLNGTAHASLDHAKYMMEDLKNQKVSLRVESGTPIFIFFSGDK